MNDILNSYLGRRCRQCLQIIHNSQPNTANFTANNSEIAAYHSLMKVQNAHNKQFKVQNSTSNAFY